MFETKDYESMTKIDLTGDERLAVAGFLEKLTEGFDKFSDISLKNAEPLVTVLDAENVMREDTPSQTVPLEDMLANAPAVHDGYYQTPKTL